jgi:putative DNA primase/helicase
VRTPANEVSQALADRISDLVRTLADGRPITQARASIRIGNRGALAIETRRPSVGIWCDHEAGCGGDALDLVRHLRGGTIRDALEWSNAWLGTPSRHEPPAVETCRRRQVSKSDFWRALWAEGQPPAGSLVERYLESRGLHLVPGLPLRFHPNCPRGSERFPAMLASMTDPVTGGPVGVHRTYLKPDGSGKAALEPSKMMMGNAGIIRLTPNEEVTGGLGIGEGIENSLAVMQFVGWRPVWAAGSAGSIAKFPVLRGVEALTIFADHDEVQANGKQPGLDAACACADHWRAAGREVKIIPPKSRGDWNDVARGVAA